MPDSTVPPSPVAAPHARPAAEVMAALGASHLGLSELEARARLARHGRNRLPTARAPGPAVLFARQFASPLIYVLLAAAAVSLGMGHLTDAAFIAGVLLLNAVIGAAQEHAAHRSAEALGALVSSRARTIRGGEGREQDAEELVPGDLVLLESGFRVPADLRLISTAGLEVDESLLTGESVAVAKAAGALVPAEAGLADRPNMAFAGSVVARGRATGVAVATGGATELGRIAVAMLSADPARPPLLIRMDRFARRIALAVLVAVLLLGGVAVARGAAPSEVFLMAVALAVSAIPEGLPVALTVTLAIGAKRMGRRNVIARRLAAVEALGSCTIIASDKTGTLTLNELTARSVWLPGSGALEVTAGGEGPEGEVRDLDGGTARGGPLDRLATAAALCNDGFLGHRDGAWVHHGDAVDVALLVLARKAGLVRAEAEAQRPRIAAIPYEPELRFAATFHQAPEAPVEAFVKGAAERVLPMCSRMASASGDVPLDARGIERAAERMSAEGYRVIALAGGELPSGGALDAAALQRLVLLGLVGLSDPLRPEAAASVRACRRAGVQVAMVTGDHPATAGAIARELGLLEGAGQVVGGGQLAEAQRAGPAAVDALVRGGRVFARVEPTQKLEIVRSMQRSGHFVAVTGDGANDAPALRAAHIGIAMGRRGTDVARESAQLILADDDFTSIVAGIEEGRIAYANVRKVVFLLVSSGAAEILLFVLAALAGLPLPLAAVQLLWLNLVTNGIQDVALAFEPGEGGELAKRPRSPDEAVFDRRMLQRTLLSAVVMAGVGFAAWWTALASGWDPDRARSGLLLMMVLFENAQAGNSRSETQSVFALSPRRNPILLYGTVAALLLHVAAMYAPGISAVLGVRPAGPAEWAAAGAGALLLVIAMELEKLAWRRSEKLAWRSEPVRE
jgi:magnesium-transporting ATPase (P-type)